MIISKERFEFLLRKLKHIHVSPYFNDPEKLPEIMAEMPNYNLYLEDKAAANKLGSKVNGLLRPCFAEPVLSHEQQMHLFRKYNFLKYRMHDLLNGPYQPKNKKYLTANQIYEGELTRIRHLLITSNLRLVITPAKKYPPFCFEVLIEDGYHSVVKCIDTFDWTTGNKFNTYAIWAIKKNFIRELFEKKQAPMRPIGRSDLQIPENRIDFDQETSNKQLKAILAVLTDERERFVIQHAYGIDCDALNRKDIAAMAGRCAEWVRQFEKKALDKIRFAFLGTPIVEKKRIRDRSKDRKKKVA